MAEPTSAGVVVAGAFEFQRRLKELFFYDPDTGLFIRRVNQGKGRSGSIAGTHPMPNGYLRIRVDGVYYYAHRLAWMYVHGAFPPDQTDHINRDRTDNRINNLRCASASENLCNRKSPIVSASGVKGVTWDPGRRLYEAKIGKNRKTIHLGRFKSREEAAMARKEAENHYHGEFARA